MKFDKYGNLLCSVHKCDNCLADYNSPMVCLLYNKDTGVKDNEHLLKMYKKECIRKNDFVQNNINVPNK